MDWNLIGTPCIAMKQCKASRKASVGYNSVIFTWTSEVAVHTKTTPNALTIDRLFTVPLKVRGPNKSTGLRVKTKLRCLKFRRKIAAENCCGKYLRKIAAENLGGHTEFMRLIICNRTMADVEISAPGKVTAPLKFLRLKIFAPIKIQAEKFGALLLFRLGRISNC